jgi:hypothetical protein
MKTPPRLSSLWVLLGLGLLAGVGQAAPGAPVPASTDPWQVDFRYKPPQWQTSICLPDDWQKTLVGWDGALLYDYPGPFAGFGTRIAAGLGSESRWVKQELLSPRVPIVRTFKAAGGLEITQEAFAVAPPLPVRQESQPVLAIEKVGSFGAQVGWASPPPQADPAFRNIAVGLNQPVEYRFPARKGESYTVVFGLCEGWHTNAGKRILDLKLDGRTVRTVDMIAEKGRNVPALFPFTVPALNEDGWVDVAVAANPNATDKNTILNVLWVFREGQAPDLALLLGGQSPKPPLLHLDCGGNAPLMKPPRHDILTVHLRNPAAAEALVSPTLTVESQQPILPAVDRRHVFIGAGTTILLPEEYERVEARADHQTVFFFAARPIRPGREAVLAYSVARGAAAAELPGTAAHAQTLRRQAVRYWEKARLPYGQLEVPDPGIQALLDSATRNIYQAREIKKGLPAFQVGPTCYRGLWVVDGSFIMESVAYLGRLQEARDGIKYLLSFQRPDGSVMLMDGHWKETGIVLWAVTRHAKLTGDRAWLREVWPKVERAFAYIHTMRGLAPAGAPNAGLVPDGFSDGGLADQVPEYTNIYWTLAGMRAAVEAARWLGETATAEAWQREYDDFYQTFRRAAERDTRTDGKGNRYLPTRMAKGEGIPPQKAQWAFCQAVFPGRVFAPSDPLLQGNMAMLRAVEQQGLVFDTGWLKDGIWTYFGSFYGHAWLWLEQGGKAVETLYHFANHASPLLVWREEQMPVGKGAGVVGDMPHNWASAEFIRLTRHCLVLERGNELHLFEGLPARWAAPGCVTRLHEIATEFGPVSLEFSVSKNGSSATLKLTPPRRTPPERIVLHLDNWSGQSGTEALSVTKTTTQEIKLRR